MVVGVGVDVDVAAVAGAVVIRDDSGSSYLLVDYYLLDGSV